jgi:uncharacterized protein YrrD
MKTLRELKGMPILTLEEGVRLGEVRDLIVDPTSAHVLALVLDRRAPGGETQVVATANVRHVGAAAITVENRGSLVLLSQVPRFQELARLRRPIEGRMVISENGERLGQVADLLVDETTFRADSLILRSLMKRGPAIPIARVRTIGTDAIVVRPEPPAEPAAPIVSEVPVAPLPVEPLPPAIEAPAAEEPVASTGTPDEPAAAPLPSADELLPEPPAPAEAVPPPEEPGQEEPAENAWQRWVRRLGRRENE